jgi:hypothetical protein
MFGVDGGSECEHELVMVVSKRVRKERKKSKKRARDHPFIFLLPPNPQRNPPSSAHYAGAGTVAKGLF